MTDLSRHAPRTSLPHNGRRRLRSAALIVAATAVFCLGVAGPAPAATTNVTMVGRGWGHGIGMCQWGAYGYAKHGWTYDRILKHYYTGISLGKVENKVIRVRLRGGLSSVKLTCDGTFRAYTSAAKLDIPGGATAVVTWTDGKYRVTAGTRTRTFTAPVTFKPVSGLLRTVTADDWGKTGKYRGLIRVLHTSSGFTMINKLPMESYLRGVVPHEMSASWPLEALKAQACAARAYAERSRDPGEAFDVYCTTRDQAYSGVRVEAAATDAAVKGTAGVVPRYGGAVIAAFYFSTSGGHTENIENVWQTSSVAYLQGVEDPYDTYSPLHLWPENPIVHADAWYKDKLGAYGSSANPTGVKGTLRAVYVLKRGVSPRVVAAALIGTDGVTFVSGATLRSKLALRDTWVKFTSLSMTADATTVTYGIGTSLRGRVYPALKDGATVTLRYTRDGASGSIAVKTARHTQELGNGATATYSSYSFNAKPKKETSYYWSSGDGRSPKATLRVRPVVAVKASATSVAAGDTVTFTGSTTPLLPAATVWLQTKSGDDAAWTDVVSGVFDADGACSFDWTAEAGVTAARLRVPPTAGLVTAYSPAVQLTVSDAPAPAQTPLPKWKVTLSLSASKVKPGTKVSYRGAVSTASDSAVSGTVILQKRRQGDTQWLSWRTLALRDGAYSTTVAMTTADRVWQFRAKMPADASNATGYSPTRTLTVTR
ncbi:MAG TPA: SpoIID/LytB domain-containing protein [Thermoleophilia bacterium]|nr:SpoIID/LytB domain-containing protein [Thermoleophilia bacterium]